MHQKVSDTRRSPPCATVTDVAETELVRLAEQRATFVTEGIGKCTLQMFKHFGDATGNVQIKSMEGM